MWQCQTKSGANAANGHTTWKALVLRASNQRQQRVTTIRPVALAAVCAFRPHSQIDQYPRSKLRRRKIAHQSHDAALIPPLLRANLSSAPTPSEKVNSYSRRKQTCLNSLIPMPPPRQVAALLWGLQ